MFQTGLLTKKIFWVLLAVAATMLIVFIIFHTNKKHGKPKPVTTTGNVIIRDFLPNNNGDLDKLVVQAGDKEQTIHFPPHTASLIMQHFKKNDTVILTQELKPHGPQKRTELLSLQKNADVLVIKTIRPPVPAAGDSLNIDLKELKFQTDDKKNITGIITSDYYVPLPPHLLKPNEAVPEQISVKGFIRDPKTGFINIYGRIFLKPYSVTINHTHYIL